MRVADIKPRITLRPPIKTVEGVIKDVADKHNITVEQIMSRDKKRKFAWPRHEAFDRLYSETRTSLPVIADKFGIDHTSALYGIWAHRKRKAEGKIY